MTDIIFTRIYHSLEEEFGHLSKFGNIELSQGLCSLAAVTRMFGFKTEIIDALPLKLDNAALTEMILKKSPKFVGISACTMDIYRASDLAEKIKRSNSDILVIIGGAHITAVPGETMEKCPAFDVGVIGEGEDTIVELLKSYKEKGPESFESVDGIIFRSGTEKRLIRTKPRKFIDNLDKLPMPAWDMLPDLKTHYFAPAWTMHSGKTVTIITSRGCPFQCIYCDRTVFGNRVRYHGAEYVMKMIRHLHREYGIGHFRISDDNFIINKKRLFEVCNAIINEKLKISWSCLARVDSIDTETLKLMKKAGCWSIAFGIETGSQAIHDIEKKGVKLEQVAKAVQLTRKAGIKTISFNIVGHPMETIETIKATIDFNKRIRVDEFKTQFMTPFPGTELYAHADKYGTLNRDWGNMAVFTDPIFIPYGLTKEDLISWNKKGFISFYTQPRVIWAYLASIRSFAEIKMIITGGITILFWKLKDIFNHSDKTKNNKKT